MSADETAPEERTTTAPPDYEGRCLEGIDPAIVGGLIAGTGAALGPAIGELTSHWLDSRPEPEPASQVILPPGTEHDD